MNPKRFFQVVTGNALALSALYLAIGVVVEGLRVQFPSTAVLRVSYALDAFPARVLGPAQAPRPAEGGLHGRPDRRVHGEAVFGVTAVGFVFVLALGLAAMTLLVAGDRHPEAETGRTLNRGGDAARGCSRAVVRA